MEITPECRFPEKRGVIQWWTDIFREKAAKSRRIKTWLRVGGGWDGDVEENRENCAHPWKNSGYAPANRLCGSLLTTLLDIKIIDYVTHLEFRACSLMAQVLLPEKRN